MTTRNNRIRFLQNNQAGAVTTTATSSSTLSGFPVANAFSTHRWKRFVTAGSFVVSASNKTIYINDDSDKTVTLTEATYATAAALATHVQTQLNASSSAWTCTYSSSTYKFTVGRSAGTAILRFTQTTNAAWTLIGYAGVVDTPTGTGLAADARRNHTSETITFDLGAAKDCPAFCVIPPAGEVFSLGSTTTATIKANSVNSFTSPPLSVALTVETDGIFAFMDDLASTTYRYWQFEFEDKTSAFGPNFELAYVYLGDYVSPLTRNASRGFLRRLVDPSEVFVSEGGSKFWGRKTKFWIVEDVRVEKVSGSDRTELERVYSELGTSTPFIVSVDPLAEFSERTGEFTKMVTFLGEPTCTQFRYDLWDIGMAFEEVI